MNKKILLFAFALVINFTSAFSQPGKFYTFSATDVNLREKPTTNSRKLVRNNDYTKMFFSNSGNAVHYSGGVFYSPKSEGEWTQLAISDMNESFLVWTMTKFLQEFNRPIFRLKKIEDLNDRNVGIYHFLRTKAPYSGFAIRTWESADDEGLNLYFLTEDGGAALIDNVTGWFTYQEGNSPLKIDGYSIFYSDHHTEDDGFGGIDLNKLSESEVISLLKFFPAMRNSENPPAKEIEYHFVADHGAASSSMSPSHLGKEVKILYPKATK